MRRVVVTGLGAVTPIGNNVEEFWNGIKAGKCGIDKVTLFDATDFKTQIAGEVKNFEPTDFIEKKDARKMDRYTQLAMVRLMRLLRIPVLIWKTKTLGKSEL